MSCSCKKNRIAYVKGTDPVPDPLPHPVKPMESCIYCAEKHVSTAYTLFTSHPDIPAIIGELELARRHSAAEFGPVARAVSVTLYSACTRDLDTLAKLWPPLLELVAKTADDDKSDMDREGLRWEESPDTYKVVNPFLGELHLCAAWRLAFEIGYMVPNRHMIIGDLALATEQLTRFDNGFGTVLRDLRHRVQTTRAADLSIDWPAACAIPDKLVTSNLKQFKDKYAEDLGKHLGI